MNSLKTAVVVTILLGVMYGVYTTLTNQPGNTPPDNGTQWPSANIQGPAGTGAPKSPWSSKNGGAASSGGTAWSADAGQGDRATQSPRFLPGGSPKAPDPFSPRSGGSLADRSKSAADRSSPGPRGSGDGSGKDESGRTAAEDGRPSESEVRPEFTAMMDSARRKLDAGELADVLLDLTPLYGNPELTREESRLLTDLLDRLAGTVIYSREHLLERAYVVREGDTLEQIAEEYRVPSPLLAKINGIRDPSRLTPGKQLKVLHGPFEATVYLDRYELVLQVGGRYAGRFPIAVGRDQPKLEGTYTVREKLPGRPYSGPQGEIPANDPRNPLGRLWIGLDGPIGIHGTSDPSNLGHATDKGNISLGERDIEDIYDMLACGSRVTIRR